MTASRTRTRYAKYEDLHPGRRLLTAVNTACGGFILAASIYGWDFFPSWLLKWSAWSAIVLGAVGAVASVVLLVLGEDE